MYSHRFIVMNGLVIFLVIAVTNCVYGQDDDEEKWVPWAREKYLDLLACVSSPENFLGCDGYLNCDKFAPKKIIRAAESCKAQCSIKENERCMNYYCAEGVSLTLSAEVREMLVDCTTAKVPPSDLTGDEAREVNTRDRCFKSLNDTHCQKKS